jgi:hypothetical protein
MEQSLRRKIFNWFKKFWWISALLAILPGLIFTFLEIAGETYGLKENGILTNPAKFLFFSMFGVSAVFSILKAYYENYDDKRKRDAQFILERMIVSLDTIKRSKLIRFTNYINENHGKINLTPFFDITKPKDQLQSILENLQDTLADLFGLTHSEISVSVMYTTDQTPDKWDWLSNLNMPNDLNLDELLHNPKSTVHQIVNRKTTSLFFPSKNTAVSQGQYLPGPKDYAHRLYGSILCHDISIDGHKSVRAILSISTFGRQLCEENDLDAQYTIVNKILPSFERRIQLELALFYIRTVLAKRTRRRRIKA